MKKVAGIIYLVKDLELSASFYSSLGFNGQSSTEGIAYVFELNGFWVELLQEKKVVTDAFKKDSKSGKRGVGAYLHIQVDDVDKYHESLTSNGIEPSSMPEDFAWGHREFVVADPDGHKLVFYMKLAR